MDLIMIPPDSLGATLIKNKTFPWTQQGVLLVMQAAFLLIAASKSRWLWHLVVEYGRNTVSHPASGWLSTSLHLSDLPGSAHRGGPRRGRTSFGLAALASLRRDCSSRLWERNTCIVRVTLHCYYFQGKYQNKETFTQIYMVHLTR